MLEIGLYLYPGVQQATVLGLNDLFGVANMFSQKYQANKANLLRVTHWQQPGPKDLPVRVFDTEPEADPTLPSAMIVPPTLREPAIIDTTPALTPWLTGLHNQGVSRHPRRHRCGAGGRIWPQRGSNCCMARPASRTVSCRRARLSPARAFAERPDISVLIKSVSRTASCGYRAAI